MSERLGKYEISEVLGKGAMGIVYKGFDPHIRRTVALKTIRKELVEEDDGSSLIARFQNEAQAAGRLTHPGIVGVYEYGEDGSLAFIAMEYVQGNSLREYFARGTRFAEQDVVSVMVQLLDALAYAHEQGVWHRDIKPANIIVMNSGQIKIADFGIARIDSSNLTMTGAVMGTPGYMAPEQYQGQLIDWRADLFAAGVVLYQLLTNQKPFSGTPEQIAFKICYEHPLPPHQIEPGRGLERYEPLMARALAKKSLERFQTASEFRAAILDAYAAPVSPTISEDTIITERLRPKVSEFTAPSHFSGGAVPMRTIPPPSGSSPGAPRPVTTVPPAGWDAGVLKQVEMQLARFVGPVAKVMVKRAATESADLETLYAILAGNLESPTDRAAFAETRPAIHGAPHAPAAPVADSGTARGTMATQMAPARPVTQETVDEATHLLAKHLGPIAKVVVKKAAGQATSRRHLYLLLAESLESEADRTRFLNEAGA